MDGAVEGGGIPSVVLGVLNSRLAGGLVALCPSALTPGPHAADLSGRTWRTLGEPPLLGSDYNCWGQGNTGALPRWCSTSLWGFLVLRMRYVAITLLYLLLFNESWI